MATNGQQFAASTVKNVVKRIEDFLTEIESVKGTNANRCQKITKAMSAVYDEAKEKGIPRKELKAYIKGRRDLARARERLEELEKDQRAIVSMLAEAMDDKQLDFFKYEASSKVMDAALERLRGEPEKEAEAEGATVN